MIAMKLALNPHTQNRRMRNPNSFKDPDLGCAARQEKEEEWARGV